VFFNKEAVAGWPDDVRAGVESALRQATAAQRRFAEDDDTICAEKLTADGVEIVGLDDSQRAAFIDATRHEVAKMRASFDEDLIALFDESLAGA